MSCIINSGYVLDCFSTGGVQRVWLATWAEENTYEFDAEEVISGATVDPAQLYYVIEQDVEYAGLEQTITNSRENGTSFFETNVSLKFTNLDKELRNLIKSMAKAPMALIVQSNTGEFYYAGVESAGRVTEGVASLGVALGDLNGATVTVNFRSASGVFLMDGSLVGTTFPVAP